MAAAASAGMIAGFYRAWVAYRNSSGYPMGQDASPNTVSNGEVKHPYLIPGMVDVGAPTPTRAIAQRRAGQVVTGQKALGTTDLGNFSFTLADYDETFHNMVTGATIDTALATDVAITAPNALNPDPPSLVLGLSMGFQRVDGTDEYLTWIYGNVQITAPAGVGATQNDGVNPNPLQYTVIPRSTTRTPMGYLYSATALAVYNNADIAVGLRYTYPFCLSTYIDDGSATTFAVGYRPVSSDNAGVVNMFTKNGVQNHTGVSGFSVTTGATTHTAGSAADIWVATYATNYVAI